MNRLRTGGQARISFFSFQDIITSVTGILILVTLMLSFNVTTAEPVSSEEQKLQAARERLREVEAENERLQQRRLEAATLPDQMQLEAQIESLRREQVEVNARRKQLEATLASARERVAKQPTNSVAELREQIEAAEQRLEQVRPKAAQSRTNVNAVYIVPDVDARRNEKKAVAIVVSGTQLRAQRLDGSEVFEGSISSPDSLKPILTKHNPERDFLVFYFRPSGAKWFEDFRKVARQGGFEVGYDAVEEQKQLIFSTQ